MEIKAAQVSELRQRTGAGMMDCKKALVECEGDVNKAVDFLREKGIAKAAKKADRAAKQGMIFTYSHCSDSSTHIPTLGVLLELNCESDFVAKTEDFQKLGHELSMQIAAANPLYVRPEDVPADVIAHEKEVIMAQAKEEGKPEKMLERIAEGRISKFYEDNCLMNQKYIRDPNVKVSDLIVQCIAKIGENIQIRRFARFVIGA